MNRLLAECVVAQLSLFTLAAPAPQGPPAARFVLELPVTNHSAFSSPALSPDGRWLAVNHEHKIHRCDVVLLFDLDASPPVCHELLGTIGWGMNDVEFSHDGKLLIAMGPQKSKTYVAEIWDVASRKRVQVASAPAGTKLWTACFLADGKRLAVGYDTGEVEVWSFAGDQVERTLVHKHAEFVHQVRATPCGRWLVSGDFRSVVVTDAKTLKPVHRWDAPARGYKHGLSPDGTRFVTRPLEEAKYTVWETATGKKVCEIAGPEPARVGYYRVGAVFSPDGRFLATAASPAPSGKKSRDGKLAPAFGQVSVWDATTGRPVLEFKSAPYWAENVTFGKTADSLISLGYDSERDLYEPGRFKVWRLEGLPSKP